MKTTASAAVKNCFVAFIFISFRISDDYPDRAASY
jgi:hypothetical protein